MIYRQTGNRYIPNTHILNDFFQPCCRWTPTQSTYNISWVSLIAYLISLSQHNAHDFSHRENDFATVKPAVLEKIKKVFGSAQDGSYITKDTDR